MALVCYLVVNGSLRRPSYLLIGIQQNNLHTVHYTFSVHRQLMYVLFLHTKLLHQQIASDLQGRVCKKLVLCHIQWGPRCVSALRFPTVMHVNPPQQARVCKIPMSLCCLFIGKKPTVPCRTHEARPDLALALHCWFISSVSLWCVLDILNFPEAQSTDFRGAWTSP